MSQITTHILNTSTGKPAAGVDIQLLQENRGNWTATAAATTNSDGRVAQWLVDDAEFAVSLAAGNYKLVFRTAEYFAKTAIESFYPYVEIVFTVTEDNAHYHVPLLLNPFGYSTYRGS